MKWPKKHTKNLIYKSLLNTEPKTEEQLCNAVVTLVVKKEFYRFAESQDDSDQLPEPLFANLDIKDQAHISETVKEILKDLTGNELLRIYPDSKVSLTTDGMSFVLSALPKSFF